jgi:hypothetical protein
MIRRLSMNHDAESSSCRLAFNFAVRERMNVIVESAALNVDDIARLETPVRPCDRTGQSSEADHAAARAREYAIADQDHSAR